MLFSQRIGKKPYKTEVLIDVVDDDLKNSLWTAFVERIFNDLSDDERDGYDLTTFIKKLWIHFFKRPIDSLPVSVYTGAIYQDQVIHIIRTWYFRSEWYDILDFVEISAKYLDQPVKKQQFVEWCNFFLKRELCAYRIVGEEMVRINSEEEVVEIEEALNIGDKYSPARTHLRTALQLLSDKKTPDYRNSIKESISSVEALCKIITGDKKATLGDALKVVEKKYPLDIGLKTAFSTLYGYTSNSDGIRHSLKAESSDLKFEDAKFMLVACSAFVNYLIVKTS